MKKVGECFRTPDLNGSLRCCVTPCQELVKNSTRLREHLTAAVATGGHALTASGLRIETTLEPPHVPLKVPSGTARTPPPLAGSSASHPPRSPDSLFSGSLCSTPGESLPSLPDCHVRTMRPPATSSPRIPASTPTSHPQRPSASMTPSPPSISPCTLSFSLVSQRPLTESPMDSFAGPEPSSPPLSVSCHSLPLSLASPRPLTESPVGSLSSTSPLFSPPSVESRSPMGSSRIALSSTPPLSFPPSHSIDPRSPSASLSLIPRASVSRSPQQPYFPSRIPVRTAASPTSPHHRSPSSLPSRPSLIPVRSRPASFPSRDTDSRSPTRFLYTYNSQNIKTFLTKTTLWCGMRDCKKYRNKPDQRPNFILHMRTRHSLAEVFYAVESGKSLSHSSPGGLEQTPSWAGQEEIVGVARRRQSDQLLACFVDGCSYAGIRAESLVKHVVESSSRDHSFPPLRFRLPTESEIQHEESRSATERRIQHEEEPHTPERSVTPPPRLKRAQKQPVGAREPSARHTVLSQHMHRQPTASPTRATPPPPWQPPPLGPPSSGNSPPSPPPRPPIQHRSSRRTRRQVTRNHSEPETSEGDDGEGDASNPECDPQNGDSEGEQDDDEYELTQIAPVMEKVGLRIIRPRCLQDYSRPLWLTCRTCRKGVCGINHITKPKRDHGHARKLDKATMEALEDWQKRFSQYILHSKHQNVPQPTNRPAPFVGIQLHDGMRCTECHYTCRKKSKMEGHWSQAKKLGKCLNRKAKDTKAQTFFECHPTFFAINPQLDLEASLFDLYLEQFEEKLERAQEQHVLPPSSENEVNPLLRVMLWHEHLGPFLGDHQTSSSDTSSSSQHGPQIAEPSPKYLRKNIASLRSIIALPRRLSERIPLRLVTFSYLSNVKSEFKLCEPRAKRMLTEYPSGEMWKMIDSGSLHTYGIILRKLVYSIFASCEDDHPSEYSLPLSDDDRRRAAKFRKALEKFSAELDNDDDEEDMGEDDEILEDDEDEILDDDECGILDDEGAERISSGKGVVPDDLIASFHHLVKPFLYPPPSSSHSRWDDPLECFIALFSLSKTGNFKAAEDMTQPFAHLHYLMRSAIFYEAHRRWRTSEGDLPFEDFLAEEAKVNIDPNARSRYNNIAQHQKFVSSLAFAPNKPPTARVSSDGMHITYRTTTLSVVDWRNGLHKNLTECEEETARLSMGFKPNIKEYDEDDWADKSYGIGWAGKDTFLDNPRCLLKGLINDPASGFAITNAHGQIELNVTAMAETLEKCNKLCRNIAFASMCTPGQLPRITEFADYRLLNGLIRDRNFFRDGDDIWLVNRRTKTETQVGRESFIPTKCYPRLSRLLETYFLVIRPLEKELAYHVYGKESLQIYSEYMWVQGGKKMSARSIYKEFRKFLGKYCKVDVGIKVYRQLCVEIGRVFLGSEYEIVEEGLDLLSAQRGHSLRVEQLQYAPEVNHLPAMSSDRLLRYGRVSEAWWGVGGFAESPPLLPLRQRIKTVGKAQDELLEMIKTLRMEIQELRDDLARIEEQQHRHNAY